MATLNQNEQAIFHKAVQSVVAGFDTIIIDTAAGIGESVLMLNEMATCNCIVLTPDPTSFTDAYALIKILYKRLDCKVFHLIINETKSKKEGEQVFRHMQTVLKTFLNIDPLLLGIIPKDTKVVAAVRQRTPLMLTSPDSRAAKAIQRIAQRISSLMT
jgi:flagellar biosynthesis protein FlhG